MSNIAPWFPFYVDDWLDSEKIFEMSMEEEGAYIRLLALMWRKGGHVPDNPQWICNGLRCKPAKWKKIRANFLQKEIIFESEGKLFNSKLSENLRVFNEKSKKAAQSASKRWEKEPKKTNKINCSEYANAMQSQCYRETETETETHTVTDKKEFDFCGTIPADMPATKKVNGNEWNPEKETQEQYVDRLLREATESTRPKY